MKRFNEWLANKISAGVGTMACAWIFAVIGITGVVAAFTGNVVLVLIIGSISGYFLQLVLLPIIMVSQNLQARKHEEHSVKLDAITDHLGLNPVVPEKKD